MGIHLLVGHLGLHFGQNGIVVAFMVMMVVAVMALVITMMIILFARSQVGRGRGDLGRRRGRGGELTITTTVAAAVVRTRRCDARDRTCGGSCGLLHARAIGNSLMLRLGRCIRSVNGDSILNTEKQSVTTKVA